MKYRVILFLIVFSRHSLAAQENLMWSDSIEVWQTTNAITAPRINLMSDGTAFVTWGESGNGVPSQIWCSRFKNGSFETPVGVTQPPLSPSLYGFGGYDVAVSDSQIFIVFEQLSQGILLTWSDDGGYSFNNANSVQGAIPGGYSTISAVVVDGTGNPVVSYIQYKDGAATYQVRRSPDGGFNFDSGTMGNAASPGGAVCECCSSDLLASGDSIWLLYRNNNQDVRDIWVSRSINLADTFNIATDVDDTDWHINFCPIAGPRMTRSGDSLVTTWMSAASGTGRVYLSTIHAGTMKKGQQMTFQSPSGMQDSQGQADVTANGDTIGLAFVENSREIVFRYSQTGSVGLTTENIRYSKLDHVFQLPSLVFRDGVFHLVYVDATTGQILYRQGVFMKSSSLENTANKDTDNLSFYPNPSSGEITLEFGQREISAISIIDAQGNQIYYKDTIYSNEKVILALQTYPAGVYLIRVKVGEIWKSGKVVKC